MGAGLWLPGEEPVCGLIPKNFFNFVYIVCEYIFKGSFSLKSLCRFVCAVSLRS